MVSCPTHITILGQTLVGMLSLSLSECSCNEKGTEGGTKCEHDSAGKCRCEESAQGPECGECNDGYYGFGTNSFAACKGTVNLFLED